MKSRSPTEKLEFTLTFIDINDALLKGSYMIFSINKLFSQIACHEMISLMDGCPRYNQIRLAEEDQENMSFNIEDGLYCFVIMPFSLKNTRDIYQPWVEKMFKDLIGKTVKVYIDDIIIKKGNRATTPTSMKYLIGLTSTK